MAVANSASPVATAPSPAVAAVDVVNEFASADSDLACVEQVQSGDLAAFDTLVRRYRERLFAVIYSMLGNREDAADVTQDAFIKAFRSIRKFQRRSSFYTWLYRIAINRATTHLRKHRNRQFFSLEHFDETVAPSPEFLEKLVANSKTDRPTLLRELQEKLNEAIQTLSLKHRTAVILHEIDGRSHAEIAAMTGTTEGTVRSRLHYAKQQLQVSLRGFLD